MAAIPLYNAGISSGTITFNLAGNSDSFHLVPLNQNVNPNGIRFTNPPASGNGCIVRIMFVQANPAGPYYNIPITAWAGTYNGTNAYSIAWESDYEIWQSSTPSIVKLESWDQMATIIARQNASAGVRVQAVTELPAVPDVDTVYVKYTP